VLESASHKSDPTMADTVKVSRCTARAAGTGARCTLPEGHAAPHAAAGGEWPSGASQALVDLHVMEQKLRAMVQDLLIDCDLPGAAHDPTELLRWIEREFPGVATKPRQMVRV
jgi:hypothetical protein